LAAIGAPAEGLDEAAERIVVEAAGNVRPVEREGIRQLLDDAFTGRRPGAARQGMDIQSRRLADTRGKR
jgi:hypothetical protein